MILLNARLTSPADAAWWLRSGVDIAEVFRPDPGDAEVAVVEHPRSDTDWRHLAARRAGAW